MSWRLASRLSVVTLALLIVIIVALWGLRGSTTSSANHSESNLQGTDLGGTPAPDFTLTDQASQTISLAQFHGEPVVLTFMYTHCPNVCPLAAEKLHTVQTQLGKDASKVEMLAVSIDPKGDTRAAALSFSQAHGLSKNWHYLLGTQSELSPVWNSYSIYIQPSASTSVTHTEAIYLIDKQGRERVFMTDDFTTTQLTDDLKILLSE